MHCSSTAPGAYELQDEIRATEEIIDQTQKEFKEINNRVREQQQQARNAEVELQRLSLNLMEAADNGTGEVPRITSVEASGPAASTSAARASISTLTLIRGLQRTGISPQPSSRTLDTLKAVERVLRAYKFATSTDQPPFTVHDVHEIFGRPDEERRTRLDQLTEMNDAADDDDVTRSMGALPIVVWTFEATDGSRTLLRFEMNASTGNVLGCDLVFNW